MIYFCHRCSFVGPVKDETVLGLAHTKYASNPPAMCDHLARLYTGEAAAGLELLHLVREAEAARLFANR